MSKETFPLPVDSVPQDAVRYSDVISHVEIATEEPPTINFRDSNIKVLYEDLGMTSNSIGKALGVSTSRAIQLLHKQGIQMRDANSQEYVIRRVESIKKIHSDPIKKAEIVSKIHSPESDFKRSKTLRDKYEKDPEFKARQIGYLQSARAQKRREGSALKGLIKRAPEINEMYTMDRESEIRFAQSLKDNPSFSALSSQQKSVIELRFRTDGALQLTLRQVGDLMGGISRQAVHQYEAAALVKLGVYKKKKGKSSLK